MTKREAIARKADWTKALAEGRVVRYNAGMSLRSFPTVEQAQAFVTQIKTFATFDASIITIVPQSHNDLFA